MLLIASEQELGEDSLRLYQCVLQERITASPPGGHVAPAQVAQGAVGVDAALLNLPHRGRSAVAAVLWVPLAEAGPRVTTPKGADSAALGLFLCS